MGGISKEKGSFIKDLHGTTGKTALILLVSVSHLFDCIVFCCSNLITCELSFSFYLVLRVLKYKMRCKTINTAQQMCVFKSEHKKPEK